MGAQAGKKLEEVGIVTCTAIQKTVAPVTLAPLVTEGIFPLREAGGAGLLPLPGRVESNSLLGLRFNPGTAVEERESLILGP